jgi:hypothetical protein
MSTNQSIKNPNVSTLGAVKKQIPLLSLQLLAILLLATLGCSTLQNTFETAFQTERIVPVFDPEATILMRSGSVAYVKNEITAIAVPLNDVKAVDAFGIIVFNSTDHWISLRQKDCSMLDQSGKVYKPIHKSQHTFYLGKNFSPKMPPEFREDFRENRVLRSMGDLVALPTEDIEKTTVMPSRRVRFFLYFHKRSVESSSLRIIVPKVHSEFTDTETTFVFKFEVQKS